MVMSHLDTQGCDTIIGEFSRSERAKANIGSDGQQVSAHAAMHDPLGVLLNFLRFSKLHSHVPASIRGDRWAAIIARPAERILQDTDRARGPSTRHALHR
jgi:hypothetical protein